MAIDRFSSAISGDSGCTRSEECVTHLVRSCVRLITRAGQLTTPLELLIPVIKTDKESTVDISKKSEVCKIGQLVGKYLRSACCQRNSAVRIYPMDLPFRG